MVATRLLESHEQFEWETTPKLIDAPDRKISDEAAAITADAVRLAFGISEYDGRAGLTEGELISLLIDFSVFLSDVKKNTSDSLISPESSGSPSSPGESEDSTSSNSPSGSTSTASESPEGSES